MVPQYTVLVACTGTEIKKMAILFMSLLLSSAGAVKLTAYGCDTRNTTHNNNFFSASSIPVLYSKDCNFAGATANPLGPCFPSPASVKAELDLLPVGHRAISLEGTSLYWVQNSSRASIFQDSLSDGTPSPWIDQWSSVVQSRFEQWFTNFSAIGGQVDMVLADWEQGGHLYWYSFASRSTNGSYTAALLQEDRRWESLRNELNLYAKNLLGNDTNVNFDDVSDINKWVGFTGPPFQDWRPWIWDVVVVDQMLGRALNQSVFVPIQKHYPHIKFSNFAHHHHTSTLVSSFDNSGSDSGSDSGSCATCWWPWAADSAVAPIGSGSHVGTHQSTSFYGGRPFQNYTQLLVSQKADRIWEAPATPFNALVQEVKIARDMHVSNPNIPVAPWFAPRNFDVSDPGKLPNATSHMYGSSFYQESILHVLLSTGATDVLWWKPGHMRPFDVGVELMSSVLHEAESMLNSSSSSSGSNFKPVSTDVTFINDWSVPYVISGGHVFDDTNMSSTKEVYRFTPRCLQDGTASTASCTRPPAEIKNGTLASFKIGSGFEMTIKNGFFLVAENQTVAPAGFWIVVVG